MSETMPTPRTQTLANEPGYMRAEIEFGIVHKDGYEIRVSWEEEPADSPHYPGYWLARLTGCEAEDGPIGCGDSKEKALLDLCCSLACLADACYGMYREAAAAARAATPGAET